MHHAREDAPCTRPGNGGWCWSAAQWGKSSLHLHVREQLAARENTEAALMHEGRSRNVPATGADRTVGDQIGEPGGCREVSYVLELGTTRVEGGVAPRRVMRCSFGTAVVVVVGDACRVLLDCAIGEGRAPARRSRVGNLTRLPEDCDDLTSLYAAMFVTVGSETALVATLRHICVALIRTREAQRTAQRSAAD